MEQDLPPPYEAVASATTTSTSSTIVASATLSSRGRGSALIRMLRNHRGGRRDRRNILTGSIALSDEDDDYTPGPSRIRGDNLAVSE